MRPQAGRAASAHGREKGAHAPGEVGPVLASPAPVPSCEEPGATS